MTHTFDLAFFFRALPGLAKGLGLTLCIALASSLAASLLAVPVTLARLSKNPFLRGFAFAYVQLFRSLSSFILMLFIYFGLSRILINLSAFPASVLCLALLQSAYIAEIYRAMFNAIPAGQTEAARSLGFSRRLTFWDVIMPQALRMAAPLLVVQFCQTVKDSSIIAVIGGMDLMREGILAVDATNRPFEIYTAVGALYVGVMMVITVIARRLFPVAI